MLPTPAPRLQSALAGRNRSSQTAVIRAVLTSLLLLVAAVTSPAIAADPAVLAAQSERIETIHRISPAVVAVFGKGGQGGGSGVIISPDGYAATNFHVVDGQGPFMKCGLNDGRLYDAVLVGIDPTGDVALIKLLGRDDFPTADIADSDTVQVGDGAYAVGNPHLLATDFQPTVTYGLVSGVHRYQFPEATFLEYTDCIQVDASINPGNSGGPLFNEQGGLIGINGRISVKKRGRVNVGAGYAISINQVMNFLDHLKSGRIVDHATLGATVATGADSTVTVTNILEQSEAYRRGLQVGDQLVEFAGRPIDTANQFKNILGIYPDGWKLPLTYRRDGTDTKILVRLRRLHRVAELELQGEGEPKQRPMPGPPGEDKPQDDAPEPTPQLRGDGPPEKFAHLYVEQAGFANYYFNLQAQERLLKQLDPLGKFPSGQPWIMRGQLDGQTPFEFRLTDAVIAVKLDDRTSLIKLEDELSDEPPGTGGLLPAMHFLRLMLTGGRDGFSEFYYLGSEPLDGAGPRVDVLIASRGSATSRWYFDQTGGRCRGFDFSLEDDTDECEIRFEESPLSESQPFPRELTIRRAGQTPGRFEIQSLQTGSEQAAASAATR